MSKKIVILGALGYLGTELCKQYSGESWFNKIVAIDSRFVSERVSQLKDWNIEFHQGHILDKEFLKRNLNDADLIHHLAGVTDVAYVKKESNLEQDENIKKIAIEGTNNVLNSIPQKCKIIFPSTHVIFEGLKEIKQNIDENEVPCPILAYSSSKFQNEKDIKNSHKNYVILRLGSVYGYSSTDTMRINIMPNLFSKIASQSGIINLFSGGKQLKSLVPLIDVVRCMKFMGENDKINKEIFNLVKETVTVKEVAEICKKYNPKTSIKITDDETPNSGYALSNKKLLSTGFKFFYSLEESISVMIKQWSYKQNNYELEYKSRGEKEFIDKRGKISNYELTEPINLIGYIESVKGSMRANHYHPIQEQKVLLVKGQFISIYKSLLDKNAPKITHVINEGDSVVTKPNVAHTMVFTKDSIFLNLVRGEREHENYGITHTLPYPLVSNDERKELLQNYKFDCRSCGNLKLKRVVSLGYQPLANNLLKNKNQKEEMFPLEMNYCSDCHNCQLSVVVNPKKMFTNYLYLSSTSKTFRDHFEKAAKKYIKKGDIFQVVLSQRFETKLTKKPLEIYKKLRITNPSPFMYFFNFHDFQIIGASPEILVRLRDNKITVRPIAGTRPRGVNKKQDTFFSKDLLKDKKELAEHLMLLDLGRNDVGKVSKINTVKVTEKFKIEKYSHVMHIVSNVMGNFNNKYSKFKSLLAGFPAGTVSGAPKIRAMEIIDELESSKRKVYAGGIGYFSANGEFDTCIALRTALVKNNKFYVQAGAGIVADSKPQKEYVETINKAKALLSSLK